MLCIVVVFGVHSLVDWTWYVPGDACVALLCAGWLAGRGPLARPAARRAPARRRRRARSPRGCGRAGDRPVRVAGARRSPRRCSRPGRSGSRSAPKTRASRRSNSSPRTPRAALASARSRGRPRPALRRSAVHARRRPAGDRPAGARARRRCSGPCAYSPRTRRRGWRWAATTSRATRRRRCRSCRRRSTSTPQSIAPELLLAAARRSRSGRNLQRLHRRRCARVKAPLRRPSEARAHGAREQQPARAGRPAAARTCTCSKPKSASSALERARACRSAGGRRAGRSARANARSESARRSRAEAAVGGRAQQQPPARAQHAAHLRQPGGGVGDVLDHLARPDHVEARVRRAATGPRRRSARSVELGVALARARRSGSSATSTATTSAPARGELGREGALAAADVEHALARAATCASRKRRRSAKSLGSRPSGSAAQSASW